jgi:hypothetical protein
MQRSREIGSEKEKTIITKNTKIKITFIDGIL